jgi:K(+)-stimulated pyrophosphate-energized sodium pump
MIEVGLVVLTSLLGLGFAALLARGLGASSPQDGEGRRLAEAVRVAATAFQRRQAGALAVVAALSGGGVFLAYGLLRTDERATAIPPLELGVWLTGSFAVGVVLGLFATRLATVLAARAPISVASGARRSLDLALGLAIRGGTSLGLAVTAVVLLAEVGLLLALFGASGGFGDAPGAALGRVPIASFVLAGLGLGATVVALLVAVGGGVFAKAADLGADLAAAEHDLPEDDPGSPLTVADLAGDAVGLAGPATAVVAGVATITLGAGMVGGQTFRSDPGLPSAFAMTAFPLVAQAFGLVACAFGVMVVKTDEREDPRSALVRGLYVSTLLYGVGLAGSARWLLGAAWLPLVGAGALGLALVPLSVHAAQYFTEPRFRPVRALAEACRGGAVLGLLGGLAAGLEAALAFAAALALVLSGAHALGASTGLANGGLLGIALAAVGLVGPAPYLLSLHAFGASVDGARGLAEHGSGPQRLDLRSRMLLLDGVGATAKACARTYLALVQALSGSVLLAAFLVEARRRLPDGVPVTPFARADDIFVLLAVLFGVALASQLVAQSLRAVGRAARRVVEEARRELRGRPRARTDGSAAPVPLPDAAACLETLTRTALRGLAVTGLVAPIALGSVGLGLRFSRSGDNPLLAVDSVGVLLVAGTVAGVFGSILLGIAGAAWDGAKKHVVTGAHGGRHLVDDTGARRENPTYGAVAVGDSFGDALGDVASPALAALVGFLGAAAIVFLPFFL